ncbi:MFS transporter [Endozoicomonas sp. 2B-B]
MSRQSTLGGGQAWINWLLATAFVVFVFTFQTGYAITSVGMQEDLSLTVAQVGLIGSIYTWAFAVVQFSSGSILDRFGIRWVLPIAAGFVSVGGLIFANADGPKVLVLGQVLMALGASFGFVGAGFTGGSWFGAAKYGIMFCWVQFVASAAAIIGQRVLGSLVQELPWNNVLNGLALGGTALTAVMFIVMRDPTRKDQHLIPWEGGRKFLHDVVHAINEVASIPDSWINALIGGATFGTMLSMGVVWGPKYLMVAGMGQTDAFFTSSMMWGGLALGAPVWGWLSDTFRSRRKTMFIGCFLQLLTILFILLNPSMSPQQANIFFFAWGWMAGASMLNFPIAAELVEPHLIGTSAAVVNAVQFIVGGIIMAIPGRVLSGSGLVARIADIEGDAAQTVVNYQWALVCIPLILALACFLFLFLRETYPHESQA